MEKLVYVLWKKKDATVAAFAQEILIRTGPRLIDLGARALSVNLADERAAFAQGLRISPESEWIGGTLSLWLDTHLARGPAEEVLQAATAKLAGYLTLESTPIVNTKHGAPTGERLPGITTVAFLQKPARMTYEAWLDRWQGHHTQVAVETQSTFLYIQNVLVRPLTAAAPPWAAIVEEGFPAEAATDPMVFYDAGGSDEELRKRQKRMMDSCQTFIDFATLQSHPMSTYVLKAL